MKVLKQAIGTLADAVSEELDSQRQAVSDVDRRVSNNNHRLENLDLSLKQQENEMVKVKLEFQTRLACA